MPTRLIREGILSSARINALSFGAEIFYRRLMSVADDYGRYYASPGTLRGACWPTSPDKVKDSQVFEWLSECCKGADPLIVTYYVKGCNYLQIQGFNQQTRSKSKFPEYVSNCLASASQVISKCLADDTQVLSNCLASDEQLLSTSRSRNSETKSETETNQTPVARGATALDVIPVDLVERWFSLEFWPMYPRKTARKEGLKAARAHLKAESDRDDAIVGLKRQLQDFQSRDPSKVPHAATWINGRRWEDEPTPLFTPQMTDKHQIRREEALVMTRILRGVQ